LLGDGDLICCGGLVVDDGGGGTHEHGSSIGVVININIIMNTVLYDLLPLFGSTVSRIDD
jgi:hypothetical protein